MGSTSTFRRKSTLAAALLSLSGLLFVAAASGLLPLPIQPPLTQPAQAAPDAYQKAKGDYDSKNYASALTQFKALAAAYPRNALCHYYLALCHQALGHVPQAQQEFQMVQQLDRGSLGQYAAQGMRQLSGARTSSGGPIAIASAGGSGTSQARSKVRKIYEFYADW
ncbi:MAG: tetratricopeptide repeat protein [Candidatus Melainabacteria bacterium]|nr:tetratricopeptide repeat protein [Candidatus Melainabacteria bacterium]